jgi:hypothetical protein
MPRKHHSIETLNGLAESRGGKCLSPEYLGWHVNHEWECVARHRWWNTPGNVFRGNWCPVCNKTGFNEEICRAVFEKALGESFPKWKPSGLSTSNGGQMEVDGFSKKLKIAFEYHGIQHYEPTYFGKRFSDLAKQQQRDKSVQDYCTKKAVKLVIVPYFRSRLLAGKIEEIRLAAFRVGIELPAVIDPGNIYVRNSKYAYYAKIAKERGGRLVTKCYTGSGAPHTWECQEGHRWRATPNNVARGTWCTKCQGIVKHSLKEIQKIAKDRGGRCLDNEYKSVNTPMRFECSIGHQWTAHPANILRGTWCKKCSSRKAGKRRLLTVADMQSTAAARNGRFVSETYKGVTHKYKWECEEGHQWEATPNNIRRGRWCPYCSGRRKWKIDPTD